MQNRPDFQKSDPGCSKARLEDLNLVPGVPTDICFRATIIRVPRGHVYEGTRLDISYLLPIYEAKTLVRV